jgi:hypothetical protein
MSVWPSLGISHLHPELPIQYSHMHLLHKTWPVWCVGEFVENPFWHISRQLLLVAHCMRCTAAIQCKGNTHEEI